MRETDMDRNELEMLQASAAKGALNARERIEAAIDTGDLPVWVLEMCNLLERSSILYGATRAQLRRAATPLSLEPASATRH